jgi:hypothetical protein
LTPARREKIARPILLHAERFAASLDPAEQSLLLYRAAGAWLALDKAHAVRLYRDAFASALKFEPVSFRQPVQKMILDDLLPLSPPDVLDLLPRTDSKMQESLYRAVVNFSLMQADYAGAVHAFDQACALGYFNQYPATHLIANFGDSGALVAPYSSTQALRIHIFNTAMQTYARQDTSETEWWTASRIIARFQTDFPSEVVLPAIDIVLDQAAKKDKAKPLSGVQFQSYGNDISGDSRYDLELFVVAPALQRFDPERATSLLAAHPKVAEYLKRFPKGLLSFDLRESYPTSYRLKGPTSEQVPMGLQLYTSEKGARSEGLSPLDMGLEFTIPMDLNIGLGVTGSGVFFADPSSPESELYKKVQGCPSDVDDFLKLVGSVPLSRKVPAMPIQYSGPMGAQTSGYQDEFPRVQLLQGIAQGCYSLRIKTTAQTILHEELKLVSQMEPEQQTEYLATAADLYLRLDDRESAAKVVSEGFANANAELQHGLAALGLKDVPRALWPAAETYRRMITLGVNASISSTQAMVAQITDPSLREYEEIMVARALLGVPIRRYMMKFPNGSSLSGEVDVSYDRF